MLTMGASVECGNRSDTGIVSSTLGQVQECGFFTWKHKAVESLHSFVSLAYPVFTPVNNLKGVLSTTKIGFAATAPH
jgi:hypothetical protein